MPRDQVVGEHLLDLAHLGQLINWGRSWWQEENEKINFTDKSEDCSFLGQIYWVKSHSNSWPRQYTLFQIMFWDSNVPPKLWFKFCVKYLMFHFRQINFPTEVICYFQMTACCLSRKYFLNFFCFLFFNSHSLWPCTQGGLKCCLQETNA